MHQVSAKSIRNAVSQLVLAGFVFAYSGCQACCPVQNRHLLSTAACDSIASDAGYRETRWTSLESDSQWETSEEYEEDWPELESQEIPLTIVEQASFDEPAVEASLETHRTSRSIQRVAPKLHDSDALSYDDPVVDAKLKTIEVDYLK